MWKLGILNPAIPLFNGEYFNCIGRADRYRMPRRNNGMPYGITRNLLAMLLVSTPIAYILGGFFYLHPIKINN